jgi:hypothetical protein
MPFSTSRMNHFVVIYQALDGLSRQRFRVPALLRGKVSEPCLQAGIKIYFHAQA